MVTELCGQIGLLGHGLGGDDMANLLFIVVMAVLWLVAGLVKAMAKKKSQQEPPELDGLGGQRRPQGETWQQRLARRAEELQRRLEQEAGMRESSQSPPPARKTPARPTQAPGGKIVVRPGRGGESVIVYEPPPPQAQPPVLEESELARQRQMQEALAAARETTFGPEPEPATAGLSQPRSPGEAQKKDPHESPGPESGPIIDYSDPEALRKAIVTYEVLGKPLALREGADQPWDS